MQPRKTEEADLEKKRPLFFLIGFCISLMFVIIAFSWQTAIKDQINLRRPDVTEDYFEITYVPDVEEKRSQATGKRESKKEKLTNSEQASQGGYATIPAEEVLNDIPDHQIDLGRGQADTEQEGMKNEDPAGEGTDEVQGETEDEGLDSETAKIFQEIAYMKIHPASSSDIRRGPVVEFMFNKDIEEQIRQGAAGVDKFQKVIAERTEDRVIVSRHLYMLTEDHFTDHRSSELSAEGPDIGEGYVHLNRMTAIVRVHEHYAVNLNKVQRIEGRHLILKDSTRIPIQKAYQEMLRRSLSKYAFMYADQQQGQTVKKASYDLSYRIRKNYSRRQVSRLQYSPIPDSYSQREVSAEALMVSLDIMNVEQGFAGRLKREEVERHVTMLRNEIKRRNDQDGKREEVNFPRPYGTPDRTLKIDDNLRTSYRNVAEALHGGRVAGVMVSGQDIYIRSAGSHSIEDPGGSGERISRGGMSLAAGEEPLFLLDGMPVSREAIMSIPLTNVAVIDILKGASTAFYGSRGANGVIAVFTRKAGTASM